MLNLKPQVFQAEVRALIDLVEEEKISRRLDYIYNQTPMNDCQRCANCCFNGPQVHQLEFLNIYSYLRTLSREKQTQLGRQIVEYELLNLTTLKNKCPFLREEGCLIYLHRPLQCRLFGLYPKDDYKAIVHQCRQENKDLAGYYARSKKIRLPKDVMTYDVEQCDNNINEDGSRLVVRDDERRQLHDQIYTLSTQTLPESWCSSKPVNFSHRYTLLYIDSADLEDLKVKAIKEHLRDSDSPSLNGLLEKYDFRF